MGIHGLLRELGPPSRISLAKLSATHFSIHGRPLRLAIDISIWLFQIQSGKGGSNPALRTLYYRLLRLLTLNIHPLFVFDGPNKPLFKRHKRVGGGGAKVVSVPEFLAKQLLKHFGFPWHVAPGEAEAEAALLQQEGVVDAVLSEDVDTLMFGCGVTIRNWSSDGASSTKTPTHVDVYRVEETRERSRGLERAGMVLVALMSGGDYLPEGIPGCGPKVACDAARAGFGRDLCALSTPTSASRDPTALNEWKARLQHEIRTNESKFFSRRNTAFTLPADFPNFEVLGYYTHPCVSTPEKIARLKREVRWDEPIDYLALRGFAADAFDWRCRGGACKFIKNLAPAVLMRELRLRGDHSGGSGDVDAQEKSERGIVLAIHGTRNHATTGGELEYRVSYTPAALVPIDLSEEEEDDQFIPAGGVASALLDDSEAESEVPGTQPTSTTHEHNDGNEMDDPPPSPGKKTRNFRPFDPAAPEKIWILKPFLRAGCPLLVEDWEARLCDPRAFLKEKRRGKEAAKKKKTGEGGGITGVKKGRAKTGGGDMPVNALMAYAKVTKAGVAAAGAAAGKEENTRGLPLRDVCLNVNANANGNGNARAGDPSTGTDLAATTAGGEHPPSSTCAPNTAAHSDTTSTFRLPATQIPRELREWETAPPPPPGASSQTHPSPPRPQKPKSCTEPSLSQPQTQTPKRNKKKRAPLSPAVANLLSPSTAATPSATQRTIESYYSPSPRKNCKERVEIVDLVSSSPARSPHTAAAVVAGGAGAGSATRRSRTLSLGGDTRFIFQRDEECDGDVRGAHAATWYEDSASSGKLPDSVNVSKRRRKGGLKRWATEPGFGSGLGGNGSADADADDGDGDGDGDGDEMLAPLPLFLRSSTLRGAVAFGDSPGALPSLSSSLRAGDDDLDVTLRPMDDGGVDAEPFVSSPLPSPRMRDLGKEVQATLDLDLNWWLEGVATSISVPPVTGAEAGLDILDLSFPGPAEQFPVQRAGLLTSQSKNHPPSVVHTAATNPPNQPSSSSHLPLRSPHQIQQQDKPITNVSMAKKRILLRQSLEGWWKEVPADAEALDLSGDGSGWKMSGGRAEIVSVAQVAGTGNVRGWRKSGVEILDLTGA